MSDFDFSLEEILSKDFNKSVLRAHKRKILGGKQRMKTTKKGISGGDTALGMSEIMMSQGLTNSFPSMGEGLGQTLEPFLIASMDAANLALDVFSPFIPDDIRKMTQYLDDKGAIKKRGNRSGRFSGQSVLAPGASASGPLVGGDNPEKIWNALRAKGLSPHAVAGIMGNLQAESGFNPGIEEKDTTRKDKGYGLAQWTFGRRTALEAYAASVGKPANDLGMQIDYLWKELTESYRHVLGVLQGASVSLHDATYIFLSKFEIPKNIPGTFPVRLRFATDILNRFKGV